MTTRSTRSTPFFTSLASHPWFRMAGLIGVTSLTTAATTVTLFLPRAGQGGVPEYPQGATELSDGLVGAIEGSGSLRGFSYVSADDVSQMTSSTTLEPVPDMSLSFQSSERQTLLVTYSAYAYAASDELMHVAAFVDGVGAHPGEVQFLGDSDEDGDAKWARSHSFQWVFPDLAPGNHTVEIFFRGGFGGTVFMHRRVLTVMRAN